jgi:hypothetical protein
MTTPIMPRRTALAGAAAPPLRQLTAEEVARGAVTFPQRDRFGPTVYSDPMAAAGSSAAVQRRAQTRDEDAAAAAENARAAAAAGEMDPSIYGGYVPPPPGGAAAAPPTPAPARPTAPTAAPAPAARPKAAEAEAVAAKEADDYRQTGEPKPQNFLKVHGTGPDTFMRDSVPADPRSYEEMVERAPGAGDEAREFRTADGATIRTPGRQESYADWMEYRDATQVQQAQLEEALARSGAATSTAEAVQSRQEAIAEKPFAVENYAIERAGVEGDAKVAVEHQKRLLEQDRYTRIMEMVKRAEEQKKAIWQDHRIPAKDKQAFQDKVDQMLLLEMSAFSETNLSPRQAPFEVQLPDAQPKKE